MPTIHTVRVREEWISRAIADAGGVSGLADKLAIDKSTVSRQANHRAEASPRFIGAVLAQFPVQFADVFDVTAEPVRARLARTVRTPAA